MTKQNEKTVFFYELGGESVKNILAEKPKSIGMFIGSEGGFERSEVEEILNLGGSAATLGNRILRAETAPLAALSVIMYLTGNLGNENTEVRTDNGEEIKGGNWFNSECVMRNA